MDVRTRGCFAPVPFTCVALDDGFWAPRQQVNRTVTIPVAYRHSLETGRIEAFRLGWRPGMPNAPHVFWDSDVAKWLEAASYTLATHPDPRLREQVDELVQLICGSQQADGYLNSHFTVVEPEKRWTNLRDLHELYCAGHLMEAAVAHHLATGARDLLDALCRYADCIASVFGPGEGMRRGYPGHEEIELALVKLYRGTGQERYLDLARFFVDERGRSPSYFVHEARLRGEEQPRDGRTLEYWQAHRPVREQEAAVGHSVRAMYLYCAMADIAAETGDVTLIEACERLFRNVAGRRMYVTGGVGSTSQGERFTRDYDLPNESAYAETCAAIGLVFWTHRLLQLDCNSTYADVMERALYNGAISGVSLDGERFFYVNPLAVHRRPDDDEASERHTGTRQGWFGCACCPPNVARLIASMGQYVYSVSDTDLAVHLFAAGSASVTLRGQRIAVRQETEYPWDGRIRVAVVPAEAAEFGLRLRLPGWCRDASLSVNGRPHGFERVNGYARVVRTWRPGDEVELTLRMPIERVYAHPEVRAASGRVALQRGPILYCFEGVDNGPGVERLSLPRDAALEAVYEPGLLGGVTVIHGQAVRALPPEDEDGLYTADPVRSETVPIKAVPYCVWENREPGDMVVWLREA